MAELQRQVTSAAARAGDLMAARTQMALSLDGQVIVADRQPVKLAAMETSPHRAGRAAAPRGDEIAVDGRLRYAIEIPCGVSLRARWTPDAQIEGLDVVPAADRPLGNKEAQVL